MPLSTKSLVQTISLVMLLLSNCTSQDLPIPSPTVTVTNAPQPTATKLINNPSLPTRTKTACPPFEIDTEIPDPNTPENFIGRHYRSSEIPERLEYHQGTVIFGPGEYSFSVVTSMETLHMIWFEKLICRNNQGHAFHEIIDVAVLPVLAENERLAYWYCNIGEKNDPEIIALGEANCGDSYLSNIKQAWRLNRQTEKIETMSPEGMSCQLDIGICVPE